MKSVLVHGAQLCCNCTREVMKSVLVHGAQLCCNSAREVMKPVKSHTFKHMLHVHLVRLSWAMSKSFHVSDHSLRSQEAKLPLPTATYMQAFTTQAGRRAWDEVWLSCQVMNCIKEFYQVCPTDCGLLTD